MSEKSKERYLIESIEWLEVIYFPWGLAVVIASIFIANYYMNNYKTKRNTKIEWTVSDIATLIVLAGFLIYTFYYIPMNHFFPFLKREASTSFFALVSAALMHSTTYTLFVNFATLGGLFALLNDNRLKMKSRPSVPQEQISEFRSLNGKETKIKDANESLVIKELRNAITLLKEENSTMESCYMSGVGFQEYKNPR